jgi:hypothetical protein
MATQVVKASDFGRREADTAGLLFNRPNPRPAIDPAGVRDDIPKDSEEYGYGQTFNLTRDGKPDYRNNYLIDGKIKDTRYDRDPLGGYDQLMLKDDDRNFYRVPDQSVVNKVGDFCPCGNLTLTAAQWLWFMNLVCFIVHFSMVWVTLYFHHWSDAGPKDLTLKVFRIQINCEKRQYSNLGCHLFNFLKTQLEIHAGACDGF